MKDRRKSKSRMVLFGAYLFTCLAIIVSAYFHLSRIARNFNTEHLELITGLYAEKMNETMEYLRNYAKEDVKMVQAMEEKTPEEILERLETNLDRSVFCNIGFLLKNGELFGSEGAIFDIRKRQLDQKALNSKTAFHSDPYQSSETGTMVMTVFVPVKDSSQIHMLYVSILIEDLRKFGVYELLNGKISVHLLKADSQNFVTCISDSPELFGSWNNLLLQQKYYRYYDDYSYNQWIHEMRSGKKEGQFSAKIRGEESTISYRCISGMPGWYVVVELTNKNISDITQHFSIWGGVYGSVLVGLTVLYMLTILLWERKDKKRYMGLSATDSLTGILNRAAFQRAVEENIQKQIPGLFVFIDVDNFKQYNDSYGHNNGDLCLKHVAEAMKRCFPKECVLGRYGGDEFVVYFSNLTVGEVETCMKTFQGEISRLTLLNGEQVTLSVSAGGAVYPEQGDDFLSLCRNADAALYQVKQNGKADFRMKARKSSK